MLYLIKIVCMQKFSAFVINYQKFWQCKVPDNNNLSREHGRHSHPLNRSYQGSLSQTLINHGRMTTTIKSNGINNKDRDSIHLSKGHSITSNPSGNAIIVEVSDFILETIVQLHIKFVTNVVKRAIFKMNAKVLG